MPYKHEIKVRVYYQDTDALGIVYHGNYLNFAERGRQEYFSSRGDSLSKILKASKLSMVARHCEIEYLGSSRVDDELRIVTWAGEIKNSSSVMNSEMYVGDKLICIVKIVMVAINEKGLPTRIPEALKAVLS
jgi:acyl-CoA thioester hydrolase